MIDLIIFPCMVLRVHLFGRAHKLKFSLHEPIDMPKIIVFWAYGEYDSCQ